jgi:hypothetical protein
MMSPQMSLVYFNVNWDLGHEMNFFSHNRNLWQNKIFILLHRYIISAVVLCPDESHHRHLQ